MNTHTEAFPCGIQPDEPVYQYRNNISDKWNRKISPAVQWTFCSAEKKSNAIILSY